MTATLFDLPPVVDLRIVVVCPDCGARSPKVDVPAGWKAASVAVAVLAGHRAEMHPAVTP